MVREDGAVRRALAALAAAAVVLGACSSAQEGAAPAPPPVAGAQTTIDPAATPGGGARGGHDSHGTGEQRAAKHHRAGANGAIATPADGSGGSDDSSGSGGGNDSSTSSSAPAAAPYPAAGDYVYAQRGSESFCDPAGNCDTRDLPPTQKIASSFEHRSDDEADVIQEARSSDGRDVRTSLHFTPEAAFITDVYYKLDYRGFTVSEEYAPDPPVPSIRFPLERGKSWSATWDADTSGDYHATVGAPQEISVGGRSVRAYRIETLTHFRGEYKGKASVVVWFDPESKAIVKTSGALSLSASYGSYRTAFETTLRSAPTA